MIIDVNLIDRLGNILIWIGGTFALLFLLLVCCQAIGIGIRVSPTGLESLHQHDAYYVTTNPAQIWPALLALLAAVALATSGWGLKKQALSIQEAAKAIGVESTED